MGYSNKLLIQPCSNKEITVYKDEVLFFGICLNVSDMAINEKSVESLTGHSFHRLRLWHLPIQSRTGNAQKPTPMNLYTFHLSSYLIEKIIIQQ